MKENPITETNFVSKSILIFYSRCIQTISSKNEIKRTAFGKIYKQLHLIYLKC